MPLVHQTTDNTILTLDLVPPMELHLMLGVVNDLYDHLDKQLGENHCPITANDWSAPLGLKRLHYHGGQFNGYQCKTLLSNTKTLKEILLEAGVYSIGEPVLQVLEQFNRVKKSCFGGELNADYHVQIEKFADLYLALGKSVTPKVHAIFLHVPQFLNYNKNLQKGLGYWSEQASETVHTDFDSLWIGSSYKRAITHKSYNSQLLKCVIAYNSKHL